MAALVTAIQWMAGSCPSTDPARLRGGELAIRLCVAAVAFAPRAVVRDARPSDALALRPRQREPAARRPTLRATISQRRWPPPLRPPRWRVLDFQDQGGHAARTVHSRKRNTATGSAPKWTDASSKIVLSGMVLFLSCVAYGWHDTAGWLRPAVICCFYSPPTSQRVGS